MIKKIKFFLIIILIINFYINSYSKTAVFILGAPRSGTSALTSVLQFLGLNLGNDIRNYPLPWNAKGDFEDNSTTYLNNEILWDLKIDENDQFLHLNKLDSFQEDIAKEKIKKNLNAKFGHYSQFGIKHPKMGLILHLYIKAAKELGYEVKLIIILRNPQEIMDSRCANTNVLLKNISNYNDAFIYVFNYLHAIFKYSENEEKLVITFDELLNETENTANKLKKFLPFLKDYNQIKNQINDFLDPSLKHF